MYLTLRPKQSGYYTFNELERYSNMYYNMYYIHDLTHNEYYAFSSLMDLCNVTSLQVETTKRMNFANYNDIMYAQRTGNMHKVDRQPIRFKILTPLECEHKRFLLADVY